MKSRCHQVVAVHLGAGQQGRVEYGASQIALSAIKPDDAFGWQEGRLIYRDAPMARIVEDIGRYSQKPVLIADATAARLRFTGVLVIDEPGAMVRRLEAFLPIRSVQDGDRIVVRSRH